MPPAKKPKSSRKAAKAPKGAARKAPRKVAGKPVRKAAARKAPARKTAKPAKPGKRPKGAAAPRTVCIATDPFGDPCQNTPRLGSRYCGVHSHLG